MLLRDVERAGNRRPSPVGAEHPAGANLPAVGEAHPPDRVLIRSAPEEADDLGSGLNFRPCSSRRCDACLVEGYAPWSDRPVEAFDGGEASASLVPEPADDALVSWHLVLGEELIQNTELVQPGNPVGPDSVGGDRRAGELVAVHDQHVPAATRECDGQRRARAASADDDRVVLLLHGRSLPRVCAVARYRQMAG